MAGPCRRPRPGSLLTFLALAALAGAARAQQEPPTAPPLTLAPRPTPAPGDSVRLLVDLWAQQRRATVVAVTPSELTLRFRGADTAAAVPWNRIYWIEASRGRQSRLANLPAGLIGGAVAGVLLALVVSDDEEDDPDGERGISGSAFGAGVLAGTTLSLMLPGRPRWTPVFRPGPAVLQADSRRAMPPVPARTLLVAQWSVVPMSGATEFRAGSGAPTSVLRLGGTVAARGLTVRAGTYGLLRGPLPYVEAFYTRIEGRERDGTPELQLAGALAGGWSSRIVPWSRMALFGGAGLGVLRAKAWGASPCRGEFICDQSTWYGDGTVLTAVASGGAYARLLELGPGRRQLGLRADVRAHVPVSRKGDAGASARAHGELAAGLQLGL